MSEDNAKKSENLGRGLEELLGDDPLDFLTDENQPEDSHRDNINLSDIVQFQDQPRKHFNEDSLQTLIESIKLNGVLQPILVRPAKENANQYQLIAGERRWRAAQKAGIQKIPAIIKDISDNQALEISLIENIQREDLMPTEEARAYKKLIEQNDYTQEKLAEKLSKSRSFIANSLRLLNLPETVQQKLDQGKISAGHARSLIGRENAEYLVEKIIKQNLSVRHIEQETKKQRKSADLSNAPDVKNMEKKIEEKLGLKVKIKTNGRIGTLSIHYKSLSQFQNLVDKLIEEKTDFIL